MNKPFSLNSSRICFADKFLFTLFFIVVSSVFFPWHVFIKFFLCLVILARLLNKIKLDNTAFWLIVFSVSYSFIGLLNGSFTLLFFSYIIAPVSFYLLGKYVVQKFSYEIIIWFIILTVLFLEIYVCLGALLEMRSDSLISITRTINFPYIQEIKATLLGTVVSLGLCGLPVFIRCLITSNKVKAWAFLGLFVLSLLVILHLSNRTGLVVIVVCLAFSFMYNPSKQNKIISIIVSIFAISLLYEVGIEYDYLFEDFLNSYEKRNSISALDTGGDRTVRWIDAFNYLFFYPFGWEVNYGRIHNYWLDVARVSGIIPFFALVIATFESFIVFYDLYKIKNDFLIFIMLELYICFFMSCMVEPILEGISTYTYLFCMLWGMQREYLNYKLY